MTQINLCTNLNIITSVIKELQRSWGLIEIWGHLSQSNISNKRNRARVLLKSRCQATSHRWVEKHQSPQQPEETPEIRAGVCILYNVYISKCILALHNKPLPWQQCSTHPGDVWSAGTWPEQPVPETAIKEEHCLHVYTSTKLTEDISHVSPSSVVTRQPLGFCLF